MMRLTNNGRSFDGEQTIALFHLIGGLLQNEPELASLHGALWDLRADELAVGSHQVAGWTLEVFSTEAQAAQCEVFAPSG